MNKDGSVMKKESKENRETWGRAAPAHILCSPPTMAFARIATAHVLTHAHTHPSDCAAWSGRREGEKGLDWPFKSHLGSESLGYRKGKELMSEDRWAARWGLMLMGELKLSTQTLRGQNCRSVFLMLTPTPKPRL